MHVSHFLKACVLNWISPLKAISASPRRSRTSDTELYPAHGFIDVGMPELALLGNFEGLCRFREYVRTAFDYELQVADEIHPDYLDMVSKFSGGKSLLETHFIDCIPSTRRTLRLFRLHRADPVGTSHHPIFTRGTTGNAKPV